MIEFEFLKKNRETTRNLTRSLWLPTDENFFMSQKNDHCKCEFTETSGGSWFTVNAHLSDCGSLRKYFRIRMYPTPDEAKVLSLWLNGARWTYNRVVEMHQHDGFRSFKTIKNFSLKNDYIKQYPEIYWLLKVPYELESGEKRKDFKMHFRSRKRDHVQSMMVLGRDFNREKGAYAFLKNIVYAEKLPKVNNSVVITLDKAGRFHIHVSVPLEDRENQARISGTIVALDPGMRTFMTCHDPRGRVVEWGNRDFARIVRLNKKLDKMQGELKKNLNVSEPGIDCARRWRDSGTRFATLSMSCIVSSRDGCANVTRPSSFPSLRRAR
ncbi:16187_t:CDS:2 [Dentiscutata heterogama]|uniref:16187_t:CDS:1 n=1 Tax=Dentiscutata heterogama TaxID=1316150 RepID=A0ACA9LQP6_9GLOM|nr:16187_t:CDS:2 [Dentiscutata heterogama]